MPATELRGFIDRYWYLGASERLPQALLPPSIHSHVIFCPSRQPYSYKAGGVLSSGTGSHLLFANRLPLRTSQEGLQWRVGIRLMPTAVYALLGQVSEAGDSWAVPLTGLDLPELSIDGNCDVDNLIKAMDHYGSRLSVAYGSTSQTALAERGFAALASIGRLPGSPSRRTYQRAFRRVIGLSPSGVLQRLRAARALAEWKRNPEVSGTTLAHLAGYYDQAHFINDIAHYLGARPARYRRAPNLMSDLTGVFPPAR